MEIRVIITNNQKAVKVPTGVRMLIRRCCHAVLRMEKFEDSAEISVTFVDNEQIRELNAQYRNKDAATDVLSFPMGENGVYQPRYRREDSRRHCALRGNGNGTGKALRPQLRARDRLPDGAFYAALARL